MSGNQFALVCLLLYLCAETTARKALGIAKDFAEINRVMRITAKNTSALNREILDTNRELGEMIESYRNAAIRWRKRALVAEAKLGERI